MPDFNAVLTGYAVGDDVAIRVTIDYAASNFATGVSLTKAWLTVKTKRSDTDVNAIVQKVVTVTDVPGTGQIEENGQTGGTDVNPVLRFDVTDEETRTIGATPRWYDVQVQTNGGMIYTAEIGRIFGELDVTKDIN